MGLQYRDDESDLITLQSDADLTEARQGAELKVVVTSKQLCPSEECKVWEELKSTAGQQLNKLVGYWQEAKAAAAKQELPHPVFLLMAPLLLFGCPLMGILLPLIAVVGCGCCPFMLLPLALASGCCPLLWLPLLAVGWYATNRCKTPCCKKQAGSCKGKQGGKVQAVASSGRPITVTAVPGVGQRCHLDRGYTFTDLGDFKQPNMLYLMTSNSDKSTPVSQVMWSLHTAVPVTVHINFRSQQHAAAAKAWLQAQGWGLNLLTRSTVSTGIPNGPYSGPVYSKQCTAGQIDLMGSNCKEGTYLVFVEIPTAAPAAAPQPASDSKPEAHQKQQPQSPAMTPEAAAAPVAVAATNVQTRPASSLKQEPQQPKQQLTPMQQLQEMGYSDEALNQMVLDASSADVAQAVAKLQLLQGWVPQLQHLQEMGLNDTAKLSELLLKHQGSTNLVVRELLQARAA